MDTTQIMDTNTLLILDSFRRNFSVNYSSDKKNITKNQTNFRLKRKQFSMDALIELLHTLSSLDAQIPPPFTPHCDLKVLSSRAKTDNFVTYFSNNKANIKCFIVLKVHVKGYRKAQLQNQSSRCYDSSKLTLPWKQTESVWALWN